MSEREQNYDDETRHFPPDSDRQFGMAADEGVRQGIESIKKQVSQTMSEREKWKMSPEEIATAKKRATFAKYYWNKFGVTTAEAEVADAAAVKAREETLKEIGEWLYLAILHDHIERNKDKIFGAIAALKAGKGL